MRLLPKSRIEPDEFAELCQAHDWMFHDRSENPANGAAQYTWVTPDATVLISYVYDPTLNLSYIVTRASGLAEPCSIESVDDALRGALDSFGPGEALSLFHTCAGNLAHEVQAVHLIAASAPDDFDAAFFEGFLSIMREGREEVRSMALIATLYMPWEQVLPALDTVVASDESEEVRNLARTVRADHPMTPR